MQTLTHDDLRSDAQLEADGLNAEEIRRFRQAESEYYDMAIALEDAESAKDYEKVVELEEKVELRGLHLRYIGRNPKDVPLDDLKKLMHTVPPDSLEDSNVKLARSRIKNPATGIRAFCIRCMGGQTAEVRRCEAMHCPLWMFRLGTNPLAGKPLPPVEEIEVEDDDHVTIDDADEGEDAAE